VLNQPASPAATGISGPLAGFRIVEFAGIGPGPFACMMLADMGAEVVTLDRIGAGKNLKSVAGRGRKVVELDLKDKAAVAQVLDLLASADALIEGLRPGVMERLGLGPDVGLALHPKLVYGRMTGWGQDGPLANAAGHDINYISITGALAAIGTREKPVPPLNLVGDFGGGGMLLAFGMVCGLLEAQRSGKGQIVDAAMVDGAALLLGGIYGLAGAGIWKDGERGVNLLDGGAHFYGTYETKDGKYVSIGSIEPQFYDLLLEKTGLKGESLPNQNDRNGWAQFKSRLESIFRSKTRDEWCTIMEGSDVCFAPVLTMTEASQHPHAKARGAYVDVQGFAQPAPAPRFSRTKEGIRGAAAKRGQHTDEVLLESGFSSSELGTLRDAGVIGAQ
jgi:alpha-methylacyl-CoA racemase